MLVPAWLKLRHLRGGIVLERAAEVLLDGYTWRSRRFTRVVPALAAAVAAWLPSGNATAGEVPGRGSAQSLTQGAPVAEQPDLALELRVVGGLAALGFSENGYAVSSAHEDIRVADAGAASFGAGLRLGWFVGSYLQIGLAFSMMRYEAVGTADVRDPALYADSRWPTHSSYTVHSPAGAYLELHPWPERGWLVGLSGSVGVVPGFRDAERLGGRFYMAGYGVEVGHELGSVIKDGPGILLRYANWVGREDFLFTDFPASVSSHELTLGARWTFELPL